MATDPAHFRPKAFPPPEFPPRRLPMFAQMPPAVFPAGRGLLGLSLALKRAAIVAEVPEAFADLVMGLVAGLWLFCAVAYGIKIGRRPGVVMEDLRILPGRAGLAAASVGGFAFSAVVAFFQPQLAVGTLLLAFALHLGLVTATVRALLAAPPEARDVTPAWHLSFVGFIVGALAAIPLGWTTLATGILWATMVLAALIWGVSLWQLTRRVPPAPLRPLLAIHLAPASLFASVAGLLGMTMLGHAMTILGLGILVALVLAGRWITESGFSPLWGAFTFPLAAYASAMLINGWVLPGVLLTVLALGANLSIAWRVIRMWPGGKLAGKTNAATA
jgi:tellurite resistance protein